MSFTSALVLAAVLDGTVEDARTRAGIAGATVVVVTGGTSATAVTGPGGRFFLGDLPAGPASVVVFGNGVVTTSFGERLGEPLARRYSVEVQADEVIVVTSPAGAAQPVQTVVDAEEARRVPGTQGDPLQVVSSLSGVSRPAPAARGVVVWGAAPAESATLVDGVEVPSLYHAGGVRGALAPELVSRIDLVPGGFGAEYGRALGGLVRVGTIELSDRPHAVVAADLLDGSAAVMAPLSSRLRVAVAGRYGWLDRVARGRVDAAAAALYPLPRYHDYQGKATLRLRPGEELGLLLLGSHDRWLDTTSDWQRLALRYLRRLPAASISVTAFAGPGRESTALAGASQDRRDTAAGLRATYQTSLAESASLTLGLDALLVRSRFTRAGTLTLPAREGDAAVYGQPPGDDFNRDGWSTTGGDVAPFASLALHRGRWTVVPEIRLEAFPTTGSRLLPRVGATPVIGWNRLRGALDPRASAVYQPRPSLALTATAGIYHQPSDPADASAVFGTPGLGPTRAVHAAAGLWWRLPPITVEVTLFGRVASALVVRNPWPSPPLAGALEQDGGGRAGGGQLSIRRDVTARVSGWVAYTLSRAWRQGRLADWDQTHVLTAVASGRFGAWTVGARGRYATGSPRTPVTGATFDLRHDRWDPVLGPSNGTRLPPFLAVDLRVERLFAVGGSELGLYLDVQNATNHPNAEELVYTSDYSSSGFIHGLPILAVAGARWRL